MASKVELIVKPLDFFKSVILKYGESNIIFYDIKIRSLTKPYFRLAGQINFEKGKEVTDFDDDLIYMTGKDFKHYNSAMKYTLKDFKSFSFQFGVLANKTDLYSDVPEKFRPKLDYLFACVNNPIENENLKKIILETEEVRTNEILNLEWYEHYMKPFTEKWTRELSDLVKIKLKII